MARFRRKDQYDFGFVSPADDRDIHVADLKKEGRNGFLYESARLFRDVFLIIVVLILVGVFFIQPVVVDGESMLPQLHDGERLLVNKFVYYKVQSVSWGHLERGDIVVFWYPDDPDKSYVKRLIGLPGETVEIRDDVPRSPHSAGRPGASRRRWRTSPREHASLRCRNPSPPASRKAGPSGP